MSITLCKHTELITNFNLPFSPSKPNKTVRHRKRGCRRYISAKGKVKYTKLGDKQPHTRTIYHAKSTTYLVSSIEARSDSFVIGVDNYASRCNTNNISHFITPPSPTANAILKGSSGKLQVKGQRTIRWKILDDSGRKHSIIIHNALYVPGLDSCLLSPQHWSQQADDNAPLPDGTWCGTYSKSCVLHWDQQQFRRTMPFDYHTNTPKFYSASSTKTFKIVA